MSNKTRGPIEKSTRDPKIPLNDVEKELVSADIAYLKQQAIDNGDWERWKQSQQILGWNPDTQSEIHIVRERFITRETFFNATGRYPENDDLERCNCVQAGIFGHLSCGWCRFCHRPKFMCICDR